MKALVEYVAASLVDNPRKVRVVEHATARETRLELHVAHEEVGKVIGRHGRTARALRVLLAISGRKAHRTVSLEIAE